MTVDQAIAWLILMLEERSTTVIGRRAETVNVW
jgi:hypothetical protein